MSFQREEPNPLRPYAVPPSVGRPSIPASQGGSHGRTNASTKPAPKSSTTYGRDILSDLDYGDYLHDASPSVVEILKRIVDQGVWKYTSIFLAQPFDVAKTLLQVQDAEATGRSAKSKGKARQQRRLDHGNRRDSYNLQPDNSDDDAGSYFESSAPTRTSAVRSRRRYSSSPSPPQSATPTTPSQQDPSSLHKHNLASPSSITAAISSLWTHEGAWGVWKGTNSTFVYNVLHSTISSFLRSLLCAILGLPDPGLSASSTPPIVGPAAVAAIDIMSAPAPIISLIVTVGASGLAGALLAPIDIARTKLLLTPSTHPPRSILPTLRSLKSWIVPASIAPATILHSVLPTFMAVATPLFLRSNLGIDPVLTPTTYSVATFCSQATELGLRLPIETVLRRGQMAVLAAPGSSSARAAKQAEPLQTVVDVGVYKGLVGTMYHIVFEEGSSEKQPMKPSAGQTQPITKRKGQGMEGLFRGWRVGIWGLVGVWSASALGSGKGGEF